MLLCLVSLCLVWCFSNMFRHSCQNRKNQQGYLASRIQSTSHRDNVLFFWLFYKCFNGNYSQDLFFVVRHNSESMTRLATRSHNYDVEIARWNRKFYSKYSFSRICRLWNPFLASCFLVKYDLPRNKCNINDHHLSPWILFIYCSPCFFHSS